MYIVDSGPREHARYGGSSSGPSYTKMNRLSCRGQCRARRAAAAVRSPPPKGRRGARSDRRMARAAGGLLKFCASCSGASRAHKRICQKTMTCWIQSPTFFFGGRPAGPFARWARVAFGRGGKMTELAPPFLRVPLRRAPRKDAVLEPRSSPKGVGLSAKRLQTYWTVPQCQGTPSPGHDTPSPLRQHDSRYASRIALR